MFLFRPNWSRFAGQEAALILEPGTKLHMPEWESQPLKERRRIVSNGKITRREFLWGSAATAVTLSMGCSGLGNRMSAQQQAPNVVVIFADDLGYCDTELYGGCDRVPTPNINQLAGEGVLLTSGYVTSPVCSPSRAGLLTGRSQQRFGFEFLPEGAPKGDGGLPVGEVTLADGLQQADYITGMIGKWHLGNKEEFHPVNRGFDEFFGMVTWGSDYIDPTRNDVRYIRRVESRIKTLEDSGEQVWTGRGPDTITRGKEPVDEQAYLTEAFTREAVTFIDKHKDQPFFLYVPYTAVHGPNQVTQEYYDRFPHIEDEETRIKAGMISALDDGIGAIMDALKANSIDEDTLVVFLSDNGAGVVESASNAPLRLGKHTLFEGGIRVPFAMKWPKRIPQGVTYNHPVSALDIFPTALAAAGGTPPGNIELEGVDLLPYLDGSNSERPHETLCWRNGPNWAIRDGDWKLIYAAKRYWLYNLSDDIGERANLVTERPDIVKGLTAKYEQWNSKNIDPLWPSRGSKKMSSVSVDGVPISWVF